MFYTDGKTNTMKLIVAFLNFPNSPEKDMPFMENRNIILIVSKAGQTSKLILKYNSV